MHANSPAWLFTFLLCNCNVPCSGSCQRGQRPPGLSVTVSLSTKMETSMLRAEGYAWRALPVTTGQENWFCALAGRGDGTCMVQRSRPKWVQVIGQLGNSPRWVAMSLECAVQSMRSELQVLIFVMTANCPHAKHGSNFFRVKACLSVLSSWVNWKIYSQQRAAFVLSMWDFGVSVKRRRCCKGCERGQSPSYSKYAKHTQGALCRKQERAVLKGSTSLK